MAYIYSSSGTYDPTKKYTGNSLWGLEQQQAREAGTSITPASDYSTSLRTSINNPFSNTGFMSYASSQLGVPSGQINYTTPGFSNVLESYAQQELQAKPYWETQYSDYMSRYGGGQGNTDELLSAYLKATTGFSDFTSGNQLDPRTGSFASSTISQSPTMNKVLELDSQIRTIEDSIRISQKAQAPTSQLNNKLAELTALREQYRVRGESERAASLQGFLSQRLMKEQGTKIGQAERTSGVATSGRQRSTAWAY